MSGRYEIAVRDIVTTPSREYELKVLALVGDWAWVDAAKPLRPGLTSRPFTVRRSSLFPVPVWKHVRSGDVITVVGLNEDKLYIVLHIHGSQMWIKRIEGGHAEGVVVSLDRAKPIPREER